MRRRGSKRQGGLLNFILFGLIALIGLLVVAAVFNAMFGRRGGALALGNLLPTPTPVAPTATSLPTATPTPTATPIPRDGPPPLSFNGRTEFGAQVHCEFDLQRNLDVARDMGVTWVKQQIRWGDIENVPGTVEWACLDHVVEGAKQRGLKVMVSVTGAPVWSRGSILKSGRRDTLGPPDDLKTFGQFVASMLRRHPAGVAGSGSAIRAVEVWNEPNLDRECKDGIDGARYADLLKVTYVAIKAVDPSILVISAGIAPTPSKGGSRQTYIDDRIWFGEALNKGLADFADCMGAHANGPDGEGDITPVVQRYRAMANMPVCVTEFGYALPINGAAVPGFGWAMSHTEAGQAAKLRDGMSWAAQTGIVRVVILWNLGFDYAAGGIVGGGSDDSNKLYALRGSAVQGVKVLLRR